MTIQDDINAFGPANTAADLLLLAAETANQTTDRIVSVATVDDLPDLLQQTVTLGSVFFVDSLKIPVIAQAGCWSGLDNIVVRIDISASAWTWGCNNRGQLGDNTTTDRSSPVSVVGGFINWCQISSGMIHTAGVTLDGSAWSWGSNDFGELGNNTTTSRSSPVSVVGGFTNWCQISAGGQHTAALRTNGSAWAWGRNVWGNLGDNTTFSRSSPVSVVGGFTNWCQISAGGFHTAAVRTSGSAWAWGINFGGRLGDNTTTARSSAVSVVGGFSDWCQISAGYNHTAAVRTNGSAWAWGYNTQGNLGDNTTTNRSSPVSVVGGFSDWCQISSSETNHTAAVRTNGSAWAWGRNGSGELGDNTTTSRSSPVSVVGGFSDWCQISAGTGHTAAVRTNGSAWAWGNNSQGDLGDNTTTSRSSPVSVVSGLFNWCQISAGRCYTTAIFQF